MKITVIEPGFELISPLKGLIELVERAGRVCYKSEDRITNGSKEAQELHGEGVSSYATAEGKCVIVPKKGSVKNVVDEILGGLRSACTYVGAENLKVIFQMLYFYKG